MFAMLMLFIAPVISKSLAHQRVAMSGEHAMMAHSAAMMMDMETMTQPLPSHFQPAPGASLMDDIACGYCQLLLHVPLIAWLFIPFIWLVSRISRIPVQPIVAPLLAEHNDAEALPRAPPVALFR